MTDLAFKYDQESDTLYINFAPGRNATGIELHDHILLRIDKARRQAIGLTLFDYSILTQPTDTGPRSFPLTRLAELTPDLRELVIEIVRRAPISEFLLLSTYTPTISDAVPIVTIIPVQAPQQPA